MIHSGENIVRVTQFRSTPYNKINVLFHVRLQNLVYDNIDFNYIVPAGARPHQLLVDLGVFYRNKEWLNVNLIEDAGLLKITSMNPLREPQVEVTGRSLKMRGGAQRVN